jgi:3-oxoacyl-[acyl-carrier-protein] synthase-3
MTSSTAAVLTGVGAYLPDVVVSNTDVGARIGQSEEWIYQRTGIRERRHARPGQSTGDLAVRAGSCALRSARMSAVGAVIVATSTPDRVSPATAPEVAARLGLPPVPAFDVGAVCSGFAYGLATAAGLISARIVESVLLVGADTFSTIVNPFDRTTALIFGDGAGAVVLTAGSPEALGAVGPFDLGSEGSLSELAAVPAGGSRAKAAGQGPGNEGSYLVMNGQTMYRHAVARMSESSTAVLESAGWKVGDVDRLVAHQANSRILNAVAKRLGIPDDHCVSNIELVGNTVAASIPIALAHGADSGHMRAGQRVLLTAFGGGLTWGSAVMAWPAVEPIIEE